MHPPPRIVALRRAGQQLHDLILGKISLPARGGQHGAQRTVGRVEQLHRRGCSDERMNHCLPRLIHGRSRNLLLPRQNLPQTNVRLQRTQRIRAHRRVSDRRHRIGSFHELNDRRVVQLRKFRERQIPAAILGELLRNQPYRTLIQGGIRFPSPLDGTQREVNLQRPGFRRKVRARHQRHQQLLGAVPAARVAHPLVDQLRRRAHAENVLPYRQTARY